MNQMINKNIKKKENIFFFYIDSSKEFESNNLLKIKNFFPDFNLLLPVNFFSVFNLTKIDFSFLEKSEKMLFFFIFLILFFLKRI